MRKKRELHSYYYNHTAMINDDHACHMAFLLKLKGTVILVALSGVSLGGGDRKANLLSTCSEISDRSRVGRIIMHGFQGLHSQNPASAPMHVDACIICQPSICTVSPPTCTTAPTETSVPDSPTSTTTPWANSTTSIPGLSTGDASAIASSIVIVAAVIVVVVFVIIIFKLRRKRSSYSGTCKLNVCIDYQVSDVHCFNTCTAYDTNDGDNNYEMPVTVTGGEEEECADYECPTVTGGEEECADYECPAVTGGEEFNMEESAAYEWPIMPEGGEGDYNIVM